MIPTTINQLAEAINGKIISTCKSSQITGVSIDSRTVEPGQVFFAISGENFDGHNYIKAAIENGAVCTVVERGEVFPAGFTTPIIQVDNTISALGHFAAWYRRQLSTTVIAITGSVGKTTTRNILYQILSRHFRCRQAQKSFNNHIGVPLTLLSAQPDDEILLVELGSNASGEIESLSKMTSPNIAIISKVADAHLEGFGSIENIIKEKSAIAAGLSPEGTLFINGDQPELVDYVRAEYDVNMVTVGTDSSCDVAATDLWTSGATGSFVINGQVVNVPLPGKANLFNVLSAWAVCRELISPSEFLEAVESLRSYERRLVPVRIGSLTVLDDCYNANPASMANALQCLHSMAEESGRRSVFIAGCMAELGHQSELLHEKLGRNTTRHEVKVVLAAGPFSEHIVKGSRETAQCPLVVQSFENTDQLCDNLHKWIQPDDIILVKGSRSAGMEKAIQRLRELFEKE